MSDWLILGAHGQLGTCLQEALTERGIDFVALGSDRCDVSDRSAVDTVVRAHAPRVTVNCAAWTAVDAAEDHEADAFRVNCEAVGNIARACREHGSVLVHVSTDYVFPGTDAGPHAENAPTAPVSVYGRSKLCGEQRALDEHPDGTYIVRTAWLYSRHGGNFAKTMLRRALAGAAVRVVNDQHGQPTLADDLARHIIDLVSSPAPFGTYHGTNSGACTWFDFASLLYGRAGVDTSLVSPVSSSEFPTRAVRPRNSVLGHARTTGAGIREMRPWEDAVAASIDGIIEVLGREDRT